MTSTGRFLERRVGKCRMVDVILAAVILVTIVFTVILIATLTPKGAGSAVPEAPAKETCIDVAVIGAGIGGSYAAWKLRNRNLTISVFEYSDRIGGRFFTSDFAVAPGAFLELGAMRFKSKSHQSLNKVIDEVGLKKIPFELGYGNADETLWFLRNVQLRNTDLGTDKIPYNLPSSEKMDPDTLLWNIVNKTLNLTSNMYPSTSEFYTLTVPDGTPLYKLSLDNYYARYASREAYFYIHDTSAWEDSVGDVTAVHAPKVYASFPGDPPSSDTYLTVDGGFMKVPVAVIDAFKKANPERNKVYMNRQLIKIEKQDNGMFHLTFRKTVSKDGLTKPLQDPRDKVVMCAKKVILAIPRGAIMEIDFPTFINNPEFVKIANSAIDFQAGKIFLAYNSTWWKTGTNANITHAVTDLMNRQTYDWKTGRNNVSVIMASYHEKDYVKYWRELSKFGTPIPGSPEGVTAVTDVVKDLLETDLSLIYNVSKKDIPEAVGGAMMLWDEYPYFAGWQYFKPGFDEREVTKFMEKPSRNDDVYLVSNSWVTDGLQDWCEGSLKRVDDVLAKYFPV